MTDLTQCNGKCFTARKCSCANDNIRMGLIGQQSLAICELCSPMSNVIAKFEGNENVVRLSDEEYSAAYQGRIYWSTACSTCILVDCPKCSEKSPKFLIDQYGVCITCRVCASKLVSCKIKPLMRNCSRKSCVHDLYEMPCTHYDARTIQMDYCNHIVCSECVLRHMMCNPTALLCYTCTDILL
jgi:hypothetical protein